MGPLTPDSCQIAGSGRSKATDEASRDRLAFLIEAVQPEGGSDGPEIRTTGHERNLQIGEMPGQRRSGGHQHIMARPRRLQSPRNQWLQMAVTTGSAEENPQSPHANTV